MSVKTSNKAWGFYGTYKSCHETSDRDTARAYAAAHGAVMTVLGMDAAETKEWLDSRNGRHLADQVAKGKAADDTVAYVTKHAASIKKEWAKSRGKMFSL